MKFPQLLAFALISSRLAASTVTYTPIDNFNSAAGISVSGSNTANTTNSPVLTGNGLFYRTLSVTGGASSNSEHTSISMPGNGTLTLSTPAYSSRFVLDYTTVDPNGISINPNNWLTQTIVSSDLSTHLTWIVADWEGYSASWNQSVNAVTGSPVEYPKVFNSFLANRNFDWNHVTELAFIVTVANGADTTYSGGFLIGSNVNTPPVPEPSTYGLGLGVLALAAVAVRRRKAVKA